MSAVTAPACHRIPIAAALAAWAGLRANCGKDGGAALWQADQLATPALPAWPSGFAELDAELPGGGWPASGLTELLLRQPGSGEVGLLGPALAQLSSASLQRDLVWIAPPHPPYAPGLSVIGLKIERLIVIDPGSEADAAWAAEQVLRSGSAGAVLWWSREALPATLRRLHLAAHEGSTPLFALRPWARQQQSSPAPLRLGVEPLAGAGLSVRLFKRRGPSLARPLLLSLPHPACEGRPPYPAREGQPPYSAREGRVSRPSRQPLSVVSPSPVVADVVVGPAPALAAA